MNKVRIQILTAALLLAAAPWGQASLSHVAAVAPAPPPAVSTRAPSSALRGTPDPGSPTGMEADDGSVVDDVVEVSHEAETKAAAAAQALREKWRSLRPAWERNGLPDSEQEQALQSKSLIQNIYNSDMKNRMDFEYNLVVKPYVQNATDPTHPVDQIDMMRYQDAQREMVRWSMKQIGQSELWDTIRSVQANGSGGMFDMVKHVHVPNRAGSDYDTYRAKPVENVDNLTVPQKLARERRLDAAALAHNEGPDDPEVPTQLKPRLNPLKQSGGVLFQTNVVSGFVQGSARPGETTAVEVNRQFRKYEMDTRVHYDVGVSQLTVGVNKKITREISVDLASDHWTGNQRGDLGERDRESASVLYSLGF